MADKYITTADDFPDIDEVMIRSTDLTEQGNSKLEEVIENELPSTPQPKSEPPLTNEEQFLEANIPPAKTNSNNHPRVNDNNNSGTFHSEAVPQNAPANTAANSTALATVAPANASAPGQVFVVDRNDYARFAGFPQQADTLAASKTITVLLTAIAVLLAVVVMVLIQPLTSQASFNNPLPANSYSQPARPFNSAAMQDASFASSVGTIGQSLGSDLIDKFTARWNSRDINSLYKLLAPVARENISRRDFTRQCEKFIHLGAINNPVYKSSRSVGQYDLHQLYKLEYYAYIKNNPAVINLSVMQTPQGDFDLLNFSIFRR
jgi:hypothetical protein